MHEQKIRILAGNSTKVLGFEHWARGEKLCDDLYKKSGFPIRGNSLHKKKNQAELIIFVWIRTHSTSKLEPLAHWLLYNSCLFINKINK